MKANVTDKPQVLRQRSKADAACARTQHPHASNLGIPFPEMESTMQYQEAILLQIVMFELCECPTAQSDVWGQ